MPVPRIYEKYAADRVMSALCQYPEGLVRIGAAGQMLEAVEDDQRTVGLGSVPS